MNKIKIASEISRAQVEVVEALQTPARRATARLRQQEQNARVSGIFHCRDRGCEYRMTLLGATALLLLGFSLRIMKLRMCFALGVKRKRERCPFTPRVGFHNFAKFFR